MLKVMLCVRISEQEKKLIFAAETSVVKIFSLAHNYSFQATSLKPPLCSMTFSFLANDRKKTSFYYHCQMSLLLYHLLFMARKYKVLQATRFFKMETVISTMQIMFP